jgi:hypothetical protein
VIVFLILFSNRKGAKKNQEKKNFAPLCASAVQKNQYYKIKELEIANSPIPFELFGISEHLEVGTTFNLI